MSWISTIELAEMVGKAPRTVKKKCDGLETRKGKGNSILYNTVEALPRIYEQDDYATEKTRLTRAQAMHEELRVKEKEGILVDINEIESLLADKFLAFRSGLLSFPTRVAPVVMSADTMKEVEDYARDFVYKLLNDLAAGIYEGDLQELPATLHVEHPARP